MLQQDPPPFNVMPLGTYAFADKGYQKCLPDRLVHSIKGSPGRPLNPAQAAWNLLLAFYRSAVEHFFGLLKRWAIFACMIAFRYHSLLEYHSVLRVSGFQ
jgi:hypothetical protein